MKIKTLNLSEKEAYKTLQDYLLYKKSENNIIAQGTQIILTKNIEKKKGEIYEIGNKKIISQYPKTKTEIIYKSYIEERPIVGKSEILVKNNEIYIYEKEEYETKDLELPENIINEVLSEKEIIEKYKKDEKKLKEDIEKQIKKHRKNHYKNITLLTKKDIVSLYNNETEQYKENNMNEINPLIFVLSTQEAAYIWNRKVEEVRSAASGAGHRARRLRENLDTRKSGNTWILTTEAAQKLFGQPNPQRMKQFYQKFIQSKK